MDDLWPDDLLESPQQKTPSPQSIAREQASLLGEKTRQLVTAKLSKPPWRDSKLEKMSFQYDFWLEASVLTYSFRVFSLAHDIDFYPLWLLLDPDLLAEVCDKMAIERPKESASILIVHSQEQFEKALKTILGSEKVKRVIKVLIRQIREDSGEKLDNDDALES